MAYVEGMGTHTDKTTGLVSHLPYYVEGMGTHTDKTTGLVSHPPYRVDLRFMKGVYVGKDGKTHHSAFAAI